MLTSAESEAWQAHPPFVYVRVWRYTGKDEWHWLVYVSRSTETRGGITNDSASASRAAEEQVMLHETERALEGA